MYRFKEAIRSFTPTKKNKDKYKQTCQLSQIVVNNPTLYSVDISQRKLEIIQAAIAKDDSSTTTMRTFLYYTMKRWLHRHWDDGSHENLSAEEKIRILQSFGYHTQ